MSFGIGPFRVYASSGGRRRRYRRTVRTRRAYAPVRRSRFWQVFGILIVIGLVVEHPVISGILAALGLGAFLLIRQQNLRRERDEQQHRDMELAAQRAHAETMAALKPEDVDWLRSVGWQPPQVDPVTRPSGRS